MTTMPLTPKQEMFVQEYLKDLNATQAAIRAGYSERTAQEQSSRLLSNVMVAARIEELKGERIDRVKVEQDDVLRELLLVMRSSIENYTIDASGSVVLRENANPEAIRAVSGVKRKVKRYYDKAADEPVEVEEVEYRLWDKTRAIEMGMKHLGIMVDRLRIEDPDDILSKALGVGKEELPE